MEPSEKAYMIVHYYPPDVYSYNLVYSTREEAEENMILYREHCIEEYNKERTLFPNDLPPGERIYIEEKDVSPGRISKAHPDLFFIKVPTTNWGP